MNTWGWLTAVRGANVAFFTRAALSRKNKLTHTSCNIFHHAANTHRRTNTLISTACTAILGPKLSTNECNKCSSSSLQTANYINDNQLLWVTSQNSPLPHLVTRNPLKIGSLHYPYWRLEMTCMLYSNYSNYNVALIIAHLAQHLWFALRTTNEHH